MISSDDIVRALGFAGSAVLPLVAVGLAAIAILGRRDPSRPVCSGCAGPRDPWSDAACPACGRARMRAATRRPWWALLGLAAIVLLASRGMTPLANAIRSFVLAQQRTSDRELFERVATEPWPGGIAVGVLVRRLENGSLDPGRFRALVLDSLARSGGAPPGGLQALAVAGLDPAAPEYAGAVIAALFAAPELSGSVTPDAVRLEVPSAAARRRFGRESLEVADVVVAATIDGVALDPPQAMPLEAGRPLVLDRPRPGEPAASLDVLVERRLYAAFDAERLRDPRGGLRDPAAWPEPLARLRTTIRVALR